MKNRGQLRGARLALCLLATYLVFFAAGYGCAVKKPALKCGALYASVTPQNCPPWPLGGTWVPRGE